MNLSTIIHEQAAVVLVQGDVDAATADTVKSYLRGTLEKGWATVIVDLSGVGFMSSAGLRVILDAHQQGKISGAQILLAAPQPGVHKVLSTSGFIRIIACYDSVAEAIEGAIQGRDR